MTDPVTIPAQLLSRGFRFTRLRRAINGDSTSGKAPMDSAYYETGNYDENDPSLLSHLEGGGGYGVVTNYGDLAVFDADDLERLEELGIIARLPPMLTDETTPDSRHYYFVCPGLDKKIVLYDPKLTEEIPIEDDAGNIVGTKTVRRHLGEVQAGRAHIVGPNSPHWSGVRRQIVNNSDLPTITSDELHKILDGLAFSRSIEEIEPGDVVRKARLHPIGENLSDQIAILDVVPGWRWSRKSGDELKGDPLDHRSQSGTALAINPLKNVWRCHACESGGSSLELLAVDEGIIQCDEARPGCLSGDKFKQTIAVARSRGLLPPDPVEEARTHIETIADELKKDPSLLNDPGIQKSLGVLRNHDPLRFETSLKKCRITTAIKETLLSTLDEAEQITDECIVAEEIPVDIKAEASQIISEGWSFDYIYQVWQSRHLGDGRAGKALIISVGAQSCTNTNGIHVIVNGRRGSGKSDCIDKASELLPPQYLLFGDMSPQAVYYFAQEMPDGAIIAFDDVTFNDAYASVQKRCTTRYQQGAAHRVVLDRGPFTFTTKPRIAFWCTSVDRQFDEQLQDRYFAIDVEDSPDHKAEVISFMKERDAGIDQAVEDRETLICRVIFRDLKSHLFEVVIPFAGRITVYDGIEQRGYKILSDMVKAFCAFRYAVRERDDTGRLIAAEKDFEDAKVLFDEAEGHGEEKYTEAEKKVLRALVNCGYVATIEKLTDATALSSGRLKDILNGRGRDDQRRYGLLAKCPHLAVERVSETVQYDPGPGKPTSKTTTHNEYRLDRSFEISDVYNSRIYLENRTDNLEPLDVACRKVDVAVDVVTIDSGEEVDVDDVVKVRKTDDVSSSPSGDVVAASGAQTSQKATSATSTALPISIQGTSSATSALRPTTSTSAEPSIFGLSLSYYEDWAKENGGRLRPKTLAEDGALDEGRAKMALEMLKSGYGWTEDNGDYIPPASGGDLKQT